jgi:hypothetical protein
MSRLTYILIALLLLNWTLLSGQNQESRCYTKPELRLIADTLTRGKECCDLLSLVTMERDSLHKMVLNQRLMLSNDTTKIAYKDTINQVYKAQVIDLTKKLDTTKKISTVLIVVLAVIAILK